jgi:hypothetical protein
MNYEDAKAKMWNPRRRWVKWISCLYIQRWRGAIRIRYGYRYRHSNVIAAWYPDGRFKFRAQNYYPSITWRVNQFMPDGYSIVNHRYYSFLWDHKTEMSEARAFYIRTEDRPFSGGVYDNNKPEWIWFVGGKPKDKLGPTLREIKAKLKRSDHDRDLPRRRGRYWVRKARGVFRNRCGKRYPDRCDWRHIWPKPVTAWKGNCGCKVYTEKAESRDTVKTILEEKNATVRSAKIKIYGVEKFFTDAGSQIINEEGGYQLLTLNTGRAEREPTNRRDSRSATENLILRALRMTCPTTGTTYVNTVPPNVTTVRQSLDWIYNIENYMERVGEQT